VHKNCVKNTAKNCKPTIPIDEAQMDGDIISNTEESMSFNDHSDASQVPIENTLNRMSIDENKSNQIDNDITENYQEPVSFDINSSIKNTRYKPGPKNSRKSTQICLQRISQRVKKINGYFWAGYMVYYTNSHIDVSLNIIFLFLTLNKFI
jgi:hypothetical protein